MDEDQIGPNMNTTPVQRYVRDGPYPSGKAMPCNLKVLGSNPVGSICRTMGGLRGTMGKKILLFFCLGSPRMQDFCPGVGLSEGRV